MRAPNRREIVPMWLWDNEYSRQSLSAIDFYKTLTPYRRRLVDDFLKQLDAAEDAPARKRVTPRRLPHGDSANG